MTARFKSLFVVSALALPMLASVPAWAADAPIATIDKYDSVIDYRPHFYVAGRVGAAWNEETDFGIPALVTNDYDVGINFSGAIGREFAFAGYGARAELELGYLTNEVDSHTVAGLGTFAGSAAGGATNTFYGLANGYIDFDSQGGPITPYVSAGIGLASVDFDTHGIAPAGTVMNDSAVGFAWQIGAGVSYELSDQIDLEVGYRFFNVENVGLTSVGGVNSDVDLRSHQVNAGWRYRF
ncbi:MAG: outer membrane beta-barrel protein [Pseudomonadota bacterium]